MDLNPPFNTLNPIEVKNKKLTIMINIYFLNMQLIYTWNDC